MESSSSRSLCRGALIAHHGNEHVGNAGCADIAERGELLAISTIEQQDAAPEYLALVNGLQRSRSGEMVRMHCKLHITRFEFFHAAIEYDPAAVDEHQIGEHVLDLFDLMRGHYDGAGAIEVVVQQRIVELLAIKDVEAERRLVQHQQSHVN